MLEEKSRLVNSYGVDGILMNTIYYHIVFPLSSVYAGRKIKLLFPVGSLLLQRGGIGFERGFTPLKTTSLT